MSYDVNIQDPATGDTRQLDSIHDLRGGTYEMGGSSTAWLNITYNYGKHYAEAFGFRFRELHGKTVEEVKPLLAQAIRKLGTDRSDDYWEATPGNAGGALQDLMRLCEMCEPTDTIYIS